MCTRCLLEETLWPTCRFRGLTAPLSRCFVSYINLNEAAHPRSDLQTLTATSDVLSMHQQQPKTLQSSSKRPKSSQEQARFSQDKPRSSQNHFRSKQNQPRSSQELLKSANIKPIQTVIINWPILMSIPFLPVTSTRMPIVNSRRWCCPPQRAFNNRFACGHRLTPNSTHQC